MVDLGSDLDISDFDLSINKENCQYGGLFHLKSTHTKMLIKI